MIWYDTHLVNLASSLARFHSVCHIREYFPISGLLLDRPQPTASRELSLNPSLYSTPLLVVDVSLNLSKSAFTLRPVTALSKARPHILSTTYSRTPLIMLRQFATRSAGKSLATSSSMSARHPPQYRVGLWTVLTTTGSRLFSTSIPRHADITLTVDGKSVTVPQGECYCHFPLASVGIVANRPGRTALIYRDRLDPSM